MGEGILLQKRQQQFQRPLPPSWTQSTVLWREEGAWSTKGKREQSYKQDRMPGL
jgi:hypothetical protein